MPRSPPKDPNKPQIPYQQRRIEISELIQTIGLWNINKTALARKYNVSWECIQTDVKNILESIDIIDAESIKFELSRSYKILTKEAWKEFMNPTCPDMTRQKWGHLLIQVNREHTKFLEAFGVKDPIMLQSKDNDQITAEEWLAWLDKEKEDSEHDK